MRYENEKTLDLFRGPGTCEWCLRFCPVREPAHIFARGMGGGGRLDVRINLVALGSTKLFACPCHTNNHSGHEPTQNDLIFIVARRERVNPVDLKDALIALRWFRTDASKQWLESQAAALSKGTEKIVRKALQEMGKI